jgi:outer membrane protein, multidrug efflux system
VPVGLPSTLIEQRPDIREAEESLIAANAQIGVARAAYFPSITLTASGGLQSSSLSNLFTGPAGAWSFVGSLTQPVFTEGSLRANVRLSEAQQQESLNMYQQTIQKAFQDVSNALVAYHKDSEYRVQQELLTEALRDAVRLSNMRYRGGVTSYLEVLDENSSLFSAELNLVQARNQELQDLVSLYLALGGGWQ